ncbi:MAG: GCN5-related N-acetyltransferase [Actinomycetia bacterium]|nr:GCN5-related N-acetyltransferase [Actinomycetes bacterium]
MTTSPPRLLVRAIRPDDRAAMLEFHAGLSPETVYFRYFSPHPRLSEVDLGRFTCVDGTDRLAVVAFDGARMVAVARVDRLPATNRAEVAVVVSDDFQDRGVGTALLERLVLDARAVGIEVLEADALASNHRMLAVFHHLGFPVRNTWEAGVAHVAFAIAPNDGYARAVAARHRSFEFDQEIEAEGDPC